LPRETRTTAVGGIGLAVTGGLLGSAFRSRRAEPRRAALRRALAEGISSGELPDSADPDVLTGMLIGAFYARYIATSDVPDDWAEQTLRHMWPDAPLREKLPGSRKDLTTR
jgi:hypothetical protein